MFGRAAPDIEAKKLACADMARHVCDPWFHAVPVEAMLSKAYAAERARQIDPAKADPDVAPGA
jgi:gamma-glutamyltranspeptidase/glutathione hydrolase